jgi:hypothetical protein
LPLKPPFPTRSNPRRLPWRKAVTLCIAAVCKNVGDEVPQFVFCADHKVGTFAAQAEIGFKFKWATKNWPALVAGDLSRAEELISTFAQHLSSVELTPTNVFDEMKSAGDVFREKLADELVRKKLSVSYEYLRLNRGKFPPAMVYEVYSQIAQLDSEAEMITAGFLGGNVFIFVVNRDCTVSYREHFAAIGTGAVIAEPALFQRKQQKNNFIQETIYQVYEAKKMGEIADAVGVRTSIIVFSPPNEGGEGALELRRVTKEGSAFLDSKYKELGLKPVLNIEFEDKFLSAS